MIELPESKHLERQAQAVLLGKTIKKVHKSTNPHKFCWVIDKAEQYTHILKGQTIIDSKGHGSYLDLYFDDTTLAFGYGALVRYYEADSKRPDKYQFLIDFDDDSFLVITIAMYGAVWAFKGEFDNIYYQGGLNSVSPLSKAFTEAYFDDLFKASKPNLSVKAFLATEQRIPGFGNGVLQDILLVSGLHPKRKLQTLSDFEKSELFDNLKSILSDMTEKGGRDTEKDLFGESGAYKTLLSKNTYKHGCPFCGNAILKEAYLGGSVYYCPVCQRM